MNWDKEKMNESLEAKVRFEGLLLFRIFSSSYSPGSFCRKRGREKNIKYQISNSRIKKYRALKDTKERMEIREWEYSDEEPFQMIFRYIYVPEND